MKLLYRRCAGLDIHKKSVSACIRCRIKGEPEMQTEEAVFGTFSQELEGLGRWLKQHRIKHVAMESTGVYWIPVWNILERFAFELILVNPATVRALRGRKTDRIDARRIAEYLQYGLLQGSFVPPQPVRQWRDLTRMRTHVQQDRNRVINRIGRLLETVNIKLGSVASNIVGKSGRAILKAMAEGRTRPQQLADRAVGRLRQKLAELESALHGRPDEHFRWLLQQLLKRLESLEGELAELDRRLSEQMQPQEDLVRRLCTIPGVDVITAWILISELGTDMSQFSDAGHAASWAGLCPGNQESAGKRFSGRTRKGDRYLRRILVQNAWAAARTRNCFLSALFNRVARRRGMKKAAVAVAHRILIIAYHLIRDGGVYRERGGDAFDRLHPQRTAKRLVRRLERMGFGVTITPQPSTAVVPKCAVSKVKPRRVSTRVTPTTSCRKCAAWGIACIHVRYQKLQSSNPGSPGQSTV